MEDAARDESPRHTLTLFDDRYGIGAFERLLALLRQPCVSFAQVAHEFGVTRERVRQWHAAYLPGAPSGLERRRLCRLHHARKHLLSDALFRGFYSRAREVFAAEQITLIRTRDGLRMRAVTIAGNLVVIKRSRQPDGRRPNGRQLHVLQPCRRSADFVYYQLDADNFLFVPCGEVPASGTTYLASPGSKYHVFRNTFAALTGTSAARLAG